MKNRERLWVEQDGKCFWCHKPTVLESKLNGRPFPDTATVDHIFSRRERELRVRASRNGTPQHVMACYRCNHKRGSTTETEWRARVAQANHDRLHTTKPPA